MGNQPSSTVPAPASTRYQTSTLPDSFFAEQASASETPYPHAHDALLLTWRTDGDSGGTRVPFRSSDSVPFSLSRRDIDAHTGDLMPGNWNRTKAVSLTEVSTVVRVLFQFIGPRQHPKLLNESFDSLAEVARAAEKYKVFSAMNTCSERMRSFSDRHPRLVLLYAAYYDYPHIADECAHRVVTSENIEYFAPLLPERFRLPWLRYHAKWCQVLTKIICYSSIPSGAWFTSNCWRNCGQPIFQALGMGVHSLNETSWVFVDRVKKHTDGCNKCDELCKEWKAYADATVSGISAFSVICRESETPVSVNST